MNLSEKKIAIVGAGIGGACAALAFAKRGASVEIYEQAAAAGEVGGGLQLGPNAVKVLDQLGLGATLRSIATFPEAAIFRDYKHGRQIARMELAKSVETMFGAPYLQLHRADLLALLLDGASAAGAKLNVDNRIEDPALIDADIVVAADGIKSSLREYVAGYTEPQFTKQVAWRGLVDASRLPENLLPSAATIYFGPYQHLVTYPLRNGSLWNIVAVEERDAWAQESWSTGADPADVQAAFRGWCDPVRKLLGALETTFLWGLYDHAPLSRWQKGNVALLGDACHAMLPFLAQGAAMAIEDAFVLATCCNELPLDQALPRYEELRFARASRVQSTAAGNGRIYHNPTPVIRQALHLGINLASRKKGGLLGRYDWLYGADVTQHQISSSTQIGT